MREPQTIVLERPWGGHSAGAELRVLGPSDEIRPGTVDALRARTLLAGGLAIDPSEAKARRAAAAPTTEAEETTETTDEPAAPKRGRKARG